MRRTCARGLALASCSLLFASCDDGDATTDTGHETDATSDTAGHDTDDGGSSGTTTAALDPIDIVGSYVENFVGGSVAHEITDASWTSDYGDFVATLEYADVDNDAHFVVGEDPANPGVFSKLQWAPTEDGLYYCTVVFDATSAHDATAAVAADDSDPSTGGCNGFTWSKLEPT